MTGLGMTGSIVLVAALLLWVMSAQVFMLVLWDFRMTDVRRRVLALCLGALVMGVWLVILGMSALF